MNAWYFLALLPWLVVAITAAIRLADLVGPAHRQRRDHARRLGLIGLGCIALVQAAGPWCMGWWAYAAPSWEGAVVAWSLALVLMTTPGLPPWWDLVLGVHRDTATWKAAGWRARIRGEWQALCDSFRLTRHRAL